ncbi:hypothetical protein Lal_00025285 [Lupinus albus]|nr:hypothetical protein Lal_00025285 [Lupinus albus]
MRALGFGVLLSAFAANFINAGLSQITRPGKPPSPLLPIEIQNIQKGKHGSDTGVYDTEGRLASFVEWKILYVLAKDKDDLLTKETVRAVYDGSLFQQLEKKHSKKEINEKISL